MNRNSEFEFKNGEIKKRSEVAIIREVPIRRVITLIYNTEMRPSDEWRKKMQGHIYDYDIISVDGKPPGSHPKVTEFYGGSRAKFKPGNYNLKMRLHDRINYSSGHSTILGEKTVSVDVVFKAGHSYRLGMKFTNVKKIDFGQRTKRESHIGQRNTKITSQKYRFSADYSALIWDETKSQVVAKRKSR